MAIETKATDWQVCMLLNAAAGAGAAAGTFRFDFYSATAGITARFKFVGVGVGEGGNLSGAVLPADIGSFGPWSSITCDKAFSVWDLNGSWGRLSTISVGMGVTLGPMYITAAKNFWSLESWFHSQDVGGFGTGPGGLGGEVLIGRWTFLSTSHNVPGSSSGGGTVA
ncbi:MAG TPA: hypothetical protein VKG05_15650 [Steroidobacteraceae bacterium]|nr:hypothetical protein [Steroidobacteraceae bacterium]